MPEVQKPVLEHAAPKANQNQGLDGHLADEAATLMQNAEFPPATISEYRILLPILTLLHQVSVKALHSVGLEETPLHEVERWLDSLPTRNPSVASLAHRSVL
jgi:hypothetical protein